jgi:hypothetical protein
MSDETFAYDVFLSHSSRDKPVVRELAERLRNDGLKVWFDEWEIKPGDLIPARIEEGLQQSRVLVLAMSKNAFGSDWVTLERGTYMFRDPVNRSRRFVPLRLDDAQIPGVLKGIMYLDWRSKLDEMYLIILNTCVEAKVIQGNKHATEVGFSELKLD